MEGYSSAHLGGGHFVLRPRWSQISQWGTLACTGVRINRTRVKNKDKGVREFSSVLFLPPSSGVQSCSLSFSDHVIKAECCPITALAHRRKRPIPGSGHRKRKAGPGREKVGEHF